ncbi:MAG: hypothetical protein JJT77_10120 [Crocinitomicaceae bacterium]|nr:hypothetical protein [Crocinitomicaceae bacterium]
MKKKVFIFFILCIVGKINAQEIAINKDASLPDKSAILEIKSDEKGWLLPRMTRAERDNILSPAEGLIIYNIDSDCFNYYRLSDESWVELCFTP